jgi:dimethylamine/trimethylamine dehydrogenase
VTLESQLPGLSEWRRVVDWRLTQIEKMPKVTVYPGSLMSAEDVLESGIRDVIIATGATWRGDGIGSSHWQPIPGHDASMVFSPDDLMTGNFPSGHVIVFDDDHYYLGGVLAELLANLGCQVTLVTPAPLVSYWAHYTLEQERIQKRLFRLGVSLQTGHTLEAIYPDSVKVTGSVTGAVTPLACDSVVLVTDRAPKDQIYQSLRPALAEGKLASLRLIGDAAAPHIIAQAVYSGHLAAREFDEPPVEGTPFRREYAAL